MLNMIFFLSTYFFSVIDKGPSGEKFINKKQESVQKKNLNVTAQLKYELKWKYFLLLKTQTESPSKWPFTIFPICLCLNCLGLKASIIHFLLPKVDLCKVGKLKETAKNPFQPPADPTHQLTAKPPVGLSPNLISFEYLHCTYC